MIDLNKCKYQRGINYKTGKIVMTCPVCGGTRIDVFIYNMTGRRDGCQKCKGTGGVTL